MGWECICVVRFDLGPLLQGRTSFIQLASVNFDTAPTVMNSFQLIITYLKFSILFVFEYPFYIDCLFTIYAVALHLFERTCKLCKKDVEDEIHFGYCICSISLNMF